MNMQLAIFIWLTLGILSNLFAQGTYVSQPEIEARSLNIIHVSGYDFKDLNKNQKLDKYEDWRLGVNERIDDLVRQMTLEEKVGMLLINTLNAGSYGELTEQAVEFIEDEKMTRFIFRNPVSNNPDRTPPSIPFFGVQITPYEAAQFMNSIQELAEGTRLGIPALFKSNARNHMDYDARAGINVESGAFSSWPKESGLAATRDMDLIARFGEIMAKEWTAIGLRGMYGYMADLSTEPRWYRVHETFTEDSELASDIISTLIRNLQGESLNNRSVALTIKHFPGGGPQEGGGDPHYEFGKNQVYPANNFNYHLRPFIAAIDAGVSSIMPYYGLPVDQDYTPNNVGMAFSKGILTELLRKRLGFKGYINSDTGIIGNRAWGLEDKSVDEQILIAIEAGTDVLSGFNDNKQILNLVRDGKLSEDRVNLSVRRLLKEQYELGLFENPYVDPNRASYIVGNPSFQRIADIAQRKSIVLLQNNINLPLAMPMDTDTLRLFTMGIDINIFQESNWPRINGISGDYEIDKNKSLQLADQEIDFAIVRINVRNKSNWERRFGGASPDELDFLSFSDMAGSNSWEIIPSLQDIQSIMSTIGADRTILSIDFRQPYVIDEGSGLLDAGAILATFGVSDDALMDVLMGKFVPAGKLPFALANSSEAIRTQHSDAPGYSEKDTLFPLGFGLTYDK